MRLCEHGTRTGVIDGNLWSLRSVATRINPHASQNVQEENATQHRNGCEGELTSRTVAGLLLLLLPLLMLPMLLLLLLLLL